MDATGLIMNLIFFLVLIFPLLAKLLSQDKQQTPFDKNECS